jgi:coenzyme F420-0:L-glutamate ligase/coenzyme F420-1:gamma-L-glutamate ligase
VITATAIEGLPEMRPGDDLAALLLARHDFDSGQLLVIAHKAVSKAEGRVVELNDVVPGERATKLAAELGKDPRVIEVVLGETAEIVRAERGVLICRTRQGFVCANAGVDASNVADGSLVLLPEDPDASARALRSALGVAVVIADSFGRAWRHAQCDIAVGAAGIEPIDDWRGKTDSRGRELHATAIAVIDQAAAAADLARGGKDAGHPAVVISGLERHLIEDDGPGVAALIRTRDDDLFT